MSYISSYSREMRVEIEASRASWEGLIEGQWPLRASAWMQERASKETRVWAPVGEQQSGDSISIAPDLVRPM
eukprot:CAMPEP_0117808012 /NCGR_PEP_ID=MMETSP0948-20121206/19710_1 /TAXON_ID=44440 /ORGANISM="Chattonella subsalsa, Strain CCMP2191" /LENGTH=71 /DNA_ID=CAMNT_0005643197 /DNA_START=32 /DNA_END=244 /DNA_ORIENTATION=-